MLKVRTKFGTTYQYVKKNYKVWAIDENFIHFTQLDNGTEKELILPKSEILCISG
jgi:hypothetical protein